VDDLETSNPRGYVSYDFSVRVDDGEWIDMPTDRPTFYGPLEAADKNLFTIRNGDRIIESFWFRFEAGSSVLCLEFGTIYQTWLLGPPANRSWCKCEDEPPQDQQ
jgi:hypothetical protein